jgi:hypothetical protein
MKHLILILAFVGIIMPAFAQTFELAPETSSTITLDTTLTVDNIKFSVTLTSNNNYYQTLTSKRTGNTYRKYLGYITTYTFQNKQVFSNRDKSAYHILGLTKNNTLKKIPIILKQ